MKNCNFFESNFSAVLKFSEYLLELISGDVPLQKALDVINGISEIDSRVERGCREIYENLEMGMKFSVAISMVQSIDFPDWYVAFVSVSEENGNLQKILKQIVFILQKRREEMEKILGAVLYPIFVAVFTLFSGVMAVKHLPSFIYDTRILSELQQKSWDSFWTGAVFLILAYGSLFAVFLKLVKKKKETNVFRALGFLVENDVPILKALKKLQFFFEKDRKMESAFENVRGNLLLGVKTCECFSEAFSEIGFRKESELMRIKLELCEHSGSKAGVSQIADSLEAGAEKKMKKFLEVLNPCLIFITAVFMVIVLKNTFIPIFTGAGGF
ncbi:MAG: type II secretion system F family protein [Treponema sp.]|nr:type II secretion system F family protein [Candidatus Treponema equifaecale]